MSIHLEALEFNLRKYAVGSRTILTDAEVWTACVEELANYLKKAHDFEPSKPINHIHPVNGVGYDSTMQFVSMRGKNER